MAEVTIRDLRDRGTEVLARVENGEAVTVTRDGTPVAELRPAPQRPLPASVLLRRWRGLPPVDPAVMKADIDAVVDTSL